MNSVDKDTNAVEETGAASGADADSAPAVQQDEVEADAGSAPEATIRHDEIEVDAGPSDTAPTEDAGPEAVPSLEDELVELRNRFVRQAAEFQNYRRRTEQEKARMMEYGRAAVVQELLDVVDDFERSLEAARAAVTDGDGETPAQALAALREGVGLVYAKLMDALARAGVEPIESVGRPFNEHEHEAMMQQPAAEGQEPGVVVGEILKGYRMGDRVLRHARVIVSA